MEDENWNDEFTRCADDFVAWTKAEGLNDDQLRRLAGILYAANQSYENLLELMWTLQDDQARELNRAITLARQCNENGKRSLVELLEESKNALGKALIQGAVLGKSAAARRGAKKRHAEHHSLKADVFAWLDANFADCKNMRDAADRIAGKVVPLEWPTVRSHVTAWNKLRSAGKP